MGASLLFSSSPSLVVVFHSSIFTTTCCLICFVHVAILLSLFFFLSYFDHTSFESRVYHKQPLYCTKVGDKICVHPTLPRPTSETTLDMLFLSYPAKLKHNTRYKVKWFQSTVEIRFGKSFETKSRHWCFRTGNIRKSFHSVSSIR